MSRTFAESRALNKERQRFYDAFAVVKGGETIDEFKFRVSGRELVAREIVPFDPAMVGVDFYLAAWFLCHFGRGKERGPRIAPLCFKDTGNPYLYWNDEEFGFHREGWDYGSIRCPLEHIFGLVTGGVWDGERRLDS